LGTFAATPRSEVNARISASLSSASMKTTSAPASANACAGGHWFGPRSLPLADASGVRSCLHAPERFIEVDRLPRVGASDDEDVCALVARIHRRPHTRHRLLPRHHLLAAHVTAALRRHLVLDQDAW